MSVSNLKIVFLYPATKFFVCRSLSCWFLDDNLGIDHPAFISENFKRHCPLSLTVKQGLFRQKGGQYGSMMRVNFRQSTNKLTSDYTLYGFIFR